MHAYEFSTFLTITAETKAEAAAKAADIQDLVEASSPATLSLDDGEPIDVSDES